MSYALYSEVCCLATYPMHREILSYYTWLFRTQQLVDFVTSRIFCCTCTGIYFYHIVPLLSRGNKNDNESLSRMLQENKRITRVYNSSGYKTRLQFINNCIFNSNNFLFKGRPLRFCNGTDFNSTITGMRVQTLWPTVCKVPFQSMLEQNKVLVGI